jgi:aquaporin Z
VSFRVTALAPGASIAEAWRTHWREYLMEAAQTGALLFCIGLFASLLYSGVALQVPQAMRPFAMGAGVSVVTVLLIRSRLGRRTGAHLNPAVTLAYYYLRRVHRWDAAFYVTFQFLGAVSGMWLARSVLGDRLARPPVCYAVTTPGGEGEIIAFLAEWGLSALLMDIVLFTANHKTLIRYAPFAVGVLTICYYGFCASLSGFSVNPARSFASALFAWIWHGLWIYFVAPVGGAVSAAALYAGWMGREHVYCAKVFHDTRSTCPFHCSFPELLRGEESESGGARN